MVLPHPPPAARVLLAEDNPRLAALIGEALAAQGWAVDCLAQPQEIEAVLGQTRHDLLLLDLDIAESDGVILVRRLRRDGSALPILVVSARNALDDRVNGLDSGADDYLAKPFATVELAARCRALLRRSGSVFGSTLHAGNLSLDVGRRAVHVEGTAIELSPRETGLLEILLRRAGLVVSRSQLEQSLYALASEVTPNAIEAAVSRLRRKLAAAGASATIQTTRGLGYRLAIES